MNLDEFKKKTDAEVVEKEIIEREKEDIIAQFESFLSISRESGQAWRKKEKLAVDKFISEYIEYMKNNGFDVDNCAPHISEENYPHITSTYKGKKITLSSINYDGEKMYLNTDEKCVAEFWFALPDDAPRYRYWKDLICVNGKRFIDFGDDAKSTYIPFINSFNTKNELDEVKHKIQINIEHFSDAVRDIDKYDICIHKWGTDDTYMNFSDFINSIVL